MKLKMEFDPDLIGMLKEEIKAGEHAGEGRIRKPGAGRKSKIDSDPTLLDDLKKLIEPETSGDPMKPLLWTTKSLRKLSKALKDLKHEVPDHHPVSGIPRTGDYRAAGTDPEKPRRNPCGRYENSTAPSTHLAGCITAFGWNCAVHADRSQWCRAC